MKKATYEEMNIVVVMLSKEDILCSSKDNPFFGEEDSLTRIRRRK